jgi:hypothetical protein
MAPLRHLGTHQFVILNQLGGEMPKRTKTQNFLGWRSDIVKSVSFRLTTTLSCWRICAVDNFQERDNDSPEDLMPCLQNFSISRCSGTARA